MSDSGGTNLNDLLPKATRILREALGSEVELGEPELIKDRTRTIVARAAVRNPDRAGIESVIIKQLRDEDSTGFTDWASLAFLSCLPAAHATAPHFYGGDVEGRYFVLEDLGGSRSFEDVLTGNDASLIVPLVEKLAVQMARLQAATAEYEALFSSIRSPLPAGESIGREPELERWFAGQARVNGWFAIAGIEPAAYADCVARTAEVFRHPGPFLLFGHGDPAPSNNHINNDTIRLLDFEYGGFRHALYDITAWHILCPLPAELVELMSAAFRTELARTRVVARDETAYQEAWAHICAYRALAILSWIPLTILEGDLPWAPGFTMRQAVLAAMERLQPLAASCPGLEPLGEATVALVRALRQKWTEFEGIETVMPDWPVFAPSTGQSGSL